MTPGCKELHDEDDGGRDGEESLEIARARRQTAAGVCFLVASFLVCKNPFIKDLQMANP